MQDGGFENSVAQISADKHDSNEIPTATPMFLGLLEIQDIGLSFKNMTGGIIPSHSSVFHFW